VEQFERVVMTQKYADQASAFKAACDSFNIKPLPVVIDRLIGVWNKNRLLAKPYDDTESTLEQLKERGVVLALVSNALEGNIRPVLERYDLLKFFDGVFLSYEHSKLKSESLFTLAREKLELKEDGVLVVGDSLESDIRGAKSVGLKAVLLDRKDRREFEPKITRLSDVLSLLEVQ
ncbi:HAD family hydrolase, partial [Candidatus Woesearchaeota archaeon]